MYTNSAVALVASALLIFASGLAQAGHNLSEVERGCEVYKYSRSYGEIDCRSSVDDGREIERKCEVYFYSGKYGEVECRGSHFKDIERRCEAYLYSGNYGELDC
jgi:hypothetical protein